ncbi:hypothetical protein OZ410_13400 [Robiginitalea sp. M366]|uniref:hypothetical protein n=1 Tax=Robiginitalea aestuariiviva TaxID=3036903 RepID=UPI00240D2390|nr:hypothetical protein [Robiginitalea aestuariiviva]MDG1573319.1 hypothetical protein [Robiginitalea aestuariiviva]
MPHHLVNSNIELEIDLPLEGYEATRFDWTGKIREVKYRGVSLCGAEQRDAPHPEGLGWGFYNEFGIEGALGYGEAPIGGWFHKIGVGLLQKGEGPYDFLKTYPVQPAAFEVQSAADRLELVCRSEMALGYAYVLHKTIRLLAHGFALEYRLENTGERPIRTTEYNHNFTAIGQALIGPEYRLRFPFALRPDSFEETVNPEGKVLLGTQDLSLKGTPKDPFFFSHLSGGEAVTAQWILEHSGHGLALSEQGNFTPAKVNLWGWGHVISPELFHAIALEPGRATAWSRIYQVKELP